MRSSQIAQSVSLLVHLLHKSIVRYKYILCAQKTANSTYSTIEPDISTQWIVYLKTWSNHERNKRRNSIWSGKWPKCM